MRLNTDGVWTITSTHSRILAAVEVLSRNHEMVPLELIKTVSNVKCNLNQTLKDLCKLKFLRYGDGYKLQFSGYDCLAIYTLRKRGLQVMGDRVGTGKESDIYYGKYNGQEVVLKFHRLGRTSFRSVKNLRNYHENRRYASWLYLSKLSCEREAAFMRRFESLAVPRLLDSNRHVIVMEYLAEYTPLYQTSSFDRDKVYNLMMDFLVDLYDLGYVHGDFNEFNIMVNERSEIKVIDFPQCLPVGDAKAAEYLKRDYEGVNCFFAKKLRYLNRCRSVEQMLKSLGIEASVPDNCPDSTDP